MPREYEVKRKLQEQSGSYFVILPKIWVESSGLRQGDIMSVKFNGTVNISPQNSQEDERRNSTHVRKMEVKST